MKTIWIAFFDLLINPFPQSFIHCPISKISLSICDEFVVISPDRKLECFSSKGTEDKRSSKHYLRLRRRRRRRRRTKKKKRKSRD